MLRLRWPDCGASMASNGNLSPILPMQETINLLLLLFGLALGLCGSWWWTNIRDFRVERAWLEKLSPMRILFVLTDFLFPSLNLSGGGLDNYWVGLECVRQTYNSVYSSVESSIGEVGANKCFCGVGCGMGWNRFCFGLLPIPIVWSRWKRKWATSYGEKRELLHNELGYIGCPKFKRINHEGLDDYAPRSNWSVRPRNLALLGTKIQSEGMGCDHRTDAKFEPPPSGLFGVSINILLSGFWRLMVLDLINLLDQPNAEADEYFWVMGEKAHRYRLRSDKGAALKPYHLSNPPKKGKHHRKGSIIKDASFYKIDKENWPMNGLNESSRSASEINPIQLHGPMVEINMDTSGNNQSEDVSLDANLVAMHGEDNTIIGENTTTGLHGSLNMDREVNYNEVFLNKEDSGDSILDNLSKINHCVNVPEGALLKEMEVNSACRDTLIHTTASDATGDGTHLNYTVNTNIDMFQRTDENIWENFCMQPTSINWPIVWSNPSDRNLDNVMWSQAVSRASKECISPENNELGKGWKELFTHLLSQVNQLALNFFDGNKTMLECFEKWAGGLNTEDQEVWRKIKEPSGKRVRWLDGELVVCHPEEVIQRKKNKKQKKKRANPFISQQGGGTTGKNEGDTNGEDISKRHKIWFTRNRRQEKNKPPQPICFSQEIIPNRAPLSFLGLGKFHAGRVHTKDSQSKTKCRESHMSKLDPLFGDLVAKTERLREIVANIRTTDVNKALVSSILGMKQFKVLKFSIKMNEDGKVTNDENMVEADQGPDVLKDPQQRKKDCLRKEAGGYARVLIELKVETELSDTVKVCSCRSRTHTQATNLKEAHSRESNEPLPKDKHNHDKPPDNDGFTLVQRRKGGQRDYGIGRQSGQGFKPNGSGYARMTSNGNTRDKGNMGNFISTRNIVNNKRAQENQGNTKHTEDREGMYKPDHNGQNPMATNGTSSTVDELVKTGDQGNREVAQKVRLVETSNRFVLLNEEGEDIEGDNTTQDKPTNMNEELDKSKDAWKRKQERIVNAKFQTHTTQEERFEAKRYILDGLVPLDSTISEWSVYIIDYFRQLCSISEFGEGLQAVSRERLNSWKTNGMEMDDDVEEVDSEVDGTAGLMKTDGPTSLESNPKLTAGPNEFLANRMFMEDGIPSGAQNRRCV
ncbi:hypothetical protein L1987_82142 [Smallanthus sonchifolius]|uniref:Uncharacterized protein n=1 Tax=Smallanthus sonchifolius TaxID=185202 RepID=A0ACB8YSU1_9ASTR|nr:hypothetical protein L1987_82142 [Smallanthus sonchifolius]